MAVTCRPCSNDSLAHAAFPSRLPCSCFPVLCVQIGDGLPIAVSLVAVAMGLNLLELLPLRLPSLDLDVRQLGVPPEVQAYLAGAHSLSHSTQRHLHVTPSNVQRTDAGAVPHRQLQHCAS